jgi:phage tail P2-like protein
MTDTLLPPSATAQERALDLTTARIGDVPVPLRTLWDADTCPAALLPWLAWAMAVDTWDPAASEAAKRQSIKDSVEAHRRKGTAGALYAALAPYDVTIEEWQDQVPQGLPYTFALIAGPGLDAQDTADVISICNRLKNARSHFSFQLINDGGTFYTGAACVSGGVIAVTATA